MKSLFDELEQFGSEKLETLKRIYFSERATLVLDVHRILDKAQETLSLKADGQNIGTTGRGIGPAYASKASRTSLRIVDLQYPEEFSKRLRNMVSLARAQWPDNQLLQDYDVDAEIELHIKTFAPLIIPQTVNGICFFQKAQRLGVQILAEGANAALLDITHGTYPFVTSSNCNVGGVSTGTGLSPHSIGKVYGVVKAYTTRVGEGPFLTELDCATEGTPGYHMQTVGHEKGTSTGRSRRCGWLDIPLLLYTIFLNGVKEINLTKLDVLSGIKTLKVCVSYKFRGQIMEEGWFPSHTEQFKEIEPVYEEFQGWDENLEDCNTLNDLPLNAQKYVQMIENKCNVKIKYIGNGPSRENLIIA